MDLENNIDAHFYISDFIFFIFSPLDTKFNKLVTYGYIPKLEPAFVNGTLRHTDSWLIIIVLSFLAYTIIA